MARIYFDSNVFSNLRLNNQEKYILLNDKLKEYKEDLIFVFSHAHIRDKIKDLSDYKFLDFDFMESFVKDNYLSYHMLDKNTTFYLAKPIEVFEDNDSLDAVDFFERQMGVSYKEVRRMIENASQDNYILVNGLQTEIKEIFHNDKIGDKFVDFIKQSLYHKDKERIPYYDFYLHSYSVLDMLGFSKDKLSKKNSYNNIFNDSLHSYYARYCDFFITEDEGLRKKSKLLYEKYQCSTKILSVEEFLKQIDCFSQAVEDRASHFFKRIAVDLYNGEVISKEEETDFTCYSINLSKEYLNFFDSMSIFKYTSGDSYVYLTKINNHSLSGATFREYEMITNSLIKFLGRDFYDKATFDFEKENEEIKNKNWEGRYWDLGDTKIRIVETIEPEKDICIQIGPVTNWPHLSKF